MIIRIIVGFGFMVAGLYLAIIGVQTKTVICHRIAPDQIDCQIKSDFLGIGLWEVEIHQLQSAGVEGDTTYRVVLVTKSGDFPLTSYKSSGRRSKQKMADRINAFIANPSQPSFKHQQRGWFPLIVGCFCFLLGFFIAGIMQGFKQWVPWRAKWDTSPQEWTKVPLLGRLNRLLYRRLLPLAEVLDDRQFKIKAGTMRGLYHGRPTLFYYVRGGVGYETDQDTEFVVSLSCRSHFSFKIYKESMGTKVGKALRFVRDVEIGDPKLDRQLVFRCDSSQSFTNWMRRPEVKKKIASLALEKRVASLQHDEGFLVVTYVGSGFYVMGFASDGFWLKEEMTPWNVTRVLRNLETLAQSLES
jgi:hypothetical protein